MKNSTYTKRQSQINLGRILHTLQDNGLKISQLTEESKYASLNNELQVALAGVIEVLGHEKNIHDLIVTN